MLILSQHVQVATHIYPKSAANLLQHTKEINTEGAKFCDYLGLVATKILLI